MARKLVLSRQFERQLKDQLKWIAARSPSAATLIHGRVRAALRALRAHPLSGRPGRVAGSREFLVQRTALIIAYRVRDDVIEIAGLWHSSQQWPSDF